ncbi:MAG: endolytic transglycosylase MltG [Cytophagaceae bacterium]|nr:endolytic transglycosylase MltG [Cytophagaceae bacterium]MDW8455960.1 endolytic transglycosylase MltG [Cytophagaceae bacterium]
MSSQERKIISKRNVLLACFLLLLIIILYNVTVGTNCRIRKGMYTIYIEKKMPVMEVANMLKEKGIIHSRLSLLAMAYLMGMHYVEDGVYSIPQRSNNISICNALNKPLDKKIIHLEIPFLQNRKSLIKAIAKNSGIHPDDIWRKLNDKKFLHQTGGFNKENIFCIFITGKYVCETQREAEELIENLYGHYEFFWNEEREEKAKNINLTREEVVILASIVYMETKMPEEMPTIAGVYLNRLQKGMKLESDPTLVFANQKFAVRRLMDRDKKINSPYNTYKYKGLPPGPICSVPPSAIDAVLNYEGHDYLYFCAKDDLSGEHVFSETYEEHQKHAKKYQEQLDKKKIF